jgi:hypothetical protein
VAKFKKGDRVRMVADMDTGVIEEVKEGSDRPYRVDRDFPASTFSPGDKVEFPAVNDDEWFSEDELEAEGW